MNTKKTALLAVILATLASLVSCSHKSESIKQINKNDTPSADRILKNGKIYTLNPAQPWAEAVAIKDGKYLYVGTSSEVEAYLGENTKVDDLAGKMAMPGINDAHVHNTSGGIKTLFECNFPFTATPEDIAIRVAACVKNNPNAVWIRGGQWDSGFFDNYDIASPRRFLDTVSGNKAVLLSDDSGHNGWANSKALKLAGIDKSTPNPKDGTFVRDPKRGEPNGVLLEGAKQIVYASLPEWTDKQIQQGAQEAIRLANQFGVTGMKEANSKEQFLAAYKVLDQRGEFKVHMATSIETPYGHREQPLDYDKLDQLRKKYRSNNVHTNFVKIFTDGVPTTSRTAAMLHPYTLAEPGGEALSGMLHITPDLLKHDLIELDKRGFTVKIHTAGDRSVRVALDAIAATRQANGYSGLRHELAHAGYIDRSDIPRFAQLQAVADLSPYLWHPSPIINSVLDAVAAPRGEEYWPIKSLLEANAPVLAGSDWPSAVASIDPWVGIEAMVTRKDPRAISQGSFWAEQAISLAEALKIYTLDGANALVLQDKTGSIEVGKYADLIVLNHNLFNIPAEKINQTQVEITLFAGDEVYRRAK